MSATQESIQPHIETRTWWQTLGMLDWIWAVFVAAGTALCYREYAGNMDIYEKGILIGAGLSTVVTGWAWKPARLLVVAVAAITLLAMARYGGDLALAEQDFFLRFLVSSQSAVMWMSALFVLATVTYFIALFASSGFIGRVATAMTWCATTMGLAGLMVRWHESYLIAPDVGHIPVSNLYEVFILFSIVTALLYLFYEGRYATRALGGFVMLVVSAAVGFLLWYTFDRQAHEIQPLVPALQSYWMKIHVPANFIGYGAFALAAMVGVAYLVKARGVRLGSTGPMTRNLPALDLLDNAMYRSIGLGFAFFTVATILGAMWAAEAWGGYWSWDPKETWALIVWLNYAAWLHMRLTKGWRGTPMAWWAIVGLFVTLFAFLGVNMFLSGLHSYGEL